MERAIREWCGDKLITLDGIRGQVLRGAGHSEGLDNELIASLVNTHLVRGEQRAGAVWYELAHDRLIEPVRNNNRDWFDAHLHKVQKVATLWEAQGRPEGLLLLGAELLEAKQWAEQNESSLTTVEHKFLEESAAKQESIEKEQRQAKRLRRLLVAVAAIALLALGALGYALINFLESKRLMSKIRAATPLCLDTDFRRKNLSETTEEASRRENACRICVPPFQKKHNKVSSEESIESYRQCLKVNGW